MATLGHPPSELIDKIASSFDTSLLQISLISRRDNSESPPAFRDRHSRASYWEQVTTANIPTQESIDYPKTKSSGCTSSLKTDFNLVGISGSDAVTQTPFLKGSKNCKEIAILDGETDNAYDLQLGTSCPTRTEMQPYNRSFATIHECSSWIRRRPGSRGLGHLGVARSERWGMKRLSMDLTWYSSLRSNGSYTMPLCYMQCICCKPRDIEMVHSIFSTRGMRPLRSSSVVNLLRYLIGWMQPVSSPADACEACTSRRRTIPAWP